MNWEFFTIGKNYFLAVANTRSDNSTVNIDSKIYQWNGTSFVDFQSIPTSGAADWEFFTIGSDSFLAVAEQTDGSVYTIDSQIYQWNGSSFVEFQSIATIAANSWEFFTIDGTPYLVVANYKNGDLSNYILDSKIYQWDGTNFVEFQAIETIGAFQWQSFTIDGEHYLAVINRQNVLDYTQDSKIYR